MIRLNVPFADKEYAKALGAAWNPKDSYWFVPEGRDVSLFARWKPREISLYIDMIPETAFFANMRAELTAGEWEQVKKAVFTRANNKCEVCFGRGPKHPVECHERWSFDVETGVQKLVDLIALCPACHEATHMGLAELRNRKDIAMAHLMKVTGMTPQQAYEHRKAAGVRWKHLSSMNWKLDGSLLMAYADLSPETMEKIVLNTDPSKWELVEDAREMPFVFLNEQQKLNEVA